MIPIAQTSLGDEEIEAVVEVLKSGKLREGEKCHEFEKAFAEMVGAKCATTAANGTAALHMAYANLIRPGDEVLVPAFTFFATASMVRWAGGVPVFCDIDSRSYCLDAKDAEQRITARTKAIAAVHLFGNACEIDDIVYLARKHELKIIWDAAQVHLTQYKGKDVGAFGDAVCYSFYATKNMTTGEGGMVVSHDKQLIDRCVQYKHHGQTGKYRHSMLGTNYRMTDMEAAIGLVQLKKIKEYTRKRRENAAFLDQRLGALRSVVVPFAQAHVEHSYHQYTILFEGQGKMARDEMVQRLRARGIDIGVHYPIPLHLQPVFLQGNREILPVSEAIAGQCLSLPVHPFLSQRDLEKIVAEIEQIDEELN